MTLIVWPLKDAVFTVHNVSLGALKLPSNNVVVGLEELQYELTSLLGTPKAGIPTGDIVDAYMVYSQLTDRAEK
jgi:hypothetical protein